MMVAIPHTFIIQRHHKEAGHWLGNNGYVGRAIHHALAAADTIGAARFIECHRYDLLNRDDWRTLERWLDLLPGKILRQRPALLLARVWTLHQQWKQSEVPPLLEAVEEVLHQNHATLPETEISLSRAEIDVFLSQDLFWQGDFQGSSEAALRAMAHLTADHALSLSIATVYLGLSYQATGQGMDAERLLNELIIREQNDNPLFTTRLFDNLTVIYNAAGKLNQMEYAARRYLKGAQRHNLLVSQGWANYELGQVNYEWNNLEAAAQYFLAVTRRRYSVNQYALHQSMMGLALTYQAQGLPDEARQTVEALSELVYESESPQFYQELGSFQARLSLLQGNIVSALHWVETTEPDLHLVPGPLIEFPIITRAKVLVWPGTTTKSQEAIDLLSRLLEVAECIHSTRFLIEFLALQALAYQSLGDPATAVKLLQRSITLAKPGGYVRTFVDLGSPMARLLNERAVQDVAPEYVSRIVAAFPDTSMVAAALAGTGRQDPVELVEPLTRREEEVLRLLSEWHSYKEIADTLVIAPRTVTKHASNIYQKLGVHKRSEAIARAKTLGLLPPS